MNISINSMNTVFYSVITLFFLIMSPLSSTHINQTMVTEDAPFDFNVISSYLENVQIKTPDFILANDGTQLAYYSFIPASPKAVVLFYHGASLWSNKLYHYFAYETARNYNIAVYLVDIRGHGNSGGPRGDASFTYHVWDDVNMMVNKVKQVHPSVPLFLSGHSSGAGMLLNYHAWKPSFDIEGYIFFAPFLGARSGIQKQNVEVPFIKSVNSWVLFSNMWSSGKLFSHSPALFFNYPDSFYQSDPHLLRYYTPAMSGALELSDATRLLKNLHKPCGFFVAGQDEQIEPSAVMNYTKCLDENFAQKSSARVIEDATHLSIMMEAPALLHEAIARAIS